MSKTIDLTRSRKIELPSLNDEAQSELSKGWSFSYVYYLTELRDIYLLIAEYGYSGIPSLLTKCKEIKLKSESKNEWTNRNILERVNALKNFGLISKDGEVITNNLFESNIGTELSIEDKNVFRKIFFQYFRFREIQSWFINPSIQDRTTLVNDLNEETLINNSNVLFSFIGSGRFTNRFFFELNDRTDIFYIQDRNSDLMRFWDVFIKWGTTLDIIDKFQMKWLGINVLPEAKSLSCVYFKKNITNDFSLLTFIKNNYRSTYIYIPQLIFDIILKYRFSLVEIKDSIVNQCIDNKDYISMQRTSEIFVQEKEKILLPIYRNAYISHLLIL